MAFIREYAALSGDPFRFRVPRFIRPPKKVRGVLKKAGKLALKVAPFAAGGIGGLAIGSALSRASKLRGLIGAGRSAFGRVKALRPFEQPVEPEPVIEAPLQMPYEEPSAYDESEPEEAMLSPNDALIAAFARAYGLEAGDPGPKRKGAAAGPKAKASVKAKNRANKRAGVDPRTGSDKRRGKKKFDLGASIGAGLKATGAGLRAGGPAALEALKHLDIGALYGATQQGNIAAGATIGAKGFPGMHRRRRINPANTRALRHSASRLLAFEKLVHRTRKSLHGLKSVVAPMHHTMPSRKRGK